MTTNLLVANLSTQFHLPPPSPPPTTGESASSKPANSTYHGEDCVKALLTKLKSSIKEKEMTFALIVVITICVCVVQMILSLYICCKIKSVNYENMK